MHLLGCTECHGDLPVEGFNRPEWLSCRICGAKIRSVVFPALFRARNVGQSGERIETEGEASCFFHPAKKAVVACESCGRFLCSLCDLEMRGKHICPQCLEAGRKKGKLKDLEHHRFLYDSLALSLATWPLLIFYFTIFTAPLALYFALRYWNAPTSVLPRQRRLRQVVAVLLSVLQIAGWALLAGFLLTRK
jgi:hypothetical protein